MTADCDPHRHALSLACDAASRGLRLDTLSPISAVSFASRPHLLRSAPCEAGPFVSASPFHPSVQESRNRREPCFGRNLGDRRRQAVPWRTPFPSRSHGTLDTPFSHFDQKAYFRLLGITRPIIDETWRISPAGRPWPLRGIPWFSLVRHGPTEEVHTSSTPAPPQPHTCLKARLCACIKNARARTSCLCAYAFAYRIPHRDLRLSQSSQQRDGCKQQRRSK
jgi:hypothetical protein